MNIGDEDRFLLSCWKISIGVLVVVVGLIIDVVRFAFFGNIKRPGLVLIAFENFVYIVYFFFFVLVFRDNVVSSIYKRPYYRPFMLDVMIRFEVQVMVCLLIIYYRVD